MNTVQFAYSIFESEKYLSPHIIPQEDVIITAALLHDMCDSKYMDVDRGLKNIQYFLNSSTNMTNSDINATLHIMNTMSYSKVKKQGFPDMGNYQLAYHIVREADLLTAYDFDRSMVFHMRKNNCNIVDAYHNAVNIFNTRVLKHNEDQLFITRYSKEKSVILHRDALTRILRWRRLMKL
jgi:HD superfamily phosphodiesterase